MQVQLLLAALALAKARVGDILDAKFPKQCDFITDESKLKALWCTRRAAKSYTAGLYMAKTAQEFEGCNVLYLGLTRASAQGIIWKDILKTINRKKGLRFKFNETLLTATAQNGSIIYVAGADADEDEMFKLLGRKWKLVIIDEAQSFSVNMRNLVYGVLGPAMIDQEGTTCLMGTSGNVTQGLFFDVTQKKEKGWKLFEWTAYDNPYVAKQWAAEIEKIEETRPEFMLTALYKQWYLNKWVIDENAKVYKFDEQKNTSLSLPLDVEGWHYILGLDLAHSPDSTAFVVGCYHESSPRLYLRYAVKHLGMDFTAIAGFIKKLDKQYHFEVKVCDGANKQGVAELNNRHSLNLIASDKTEKADHIRLMNDDFIQGIIVLLSECEPLKEEYRMLVWDTDAAGVIKEPRKENPNIHNDLADAAYYLWRYSYQYLYREALPFADKSKQEVWETAHLEKLQEQAKQKANPDELKLAWDEAWNEDEGTQ